MKPLVSVIIPVYNVYAYVREALDSVINQTYQNLEIIIIDDGSEDGSDSICDEYTCDQRVRIIHQDNRGLSGARNTGLDAVSGEYIVFLDPDDAFYPDMIQLMTDAMRRSNADIIECGYELYDAELNRSRLQDFHRLNEKTLSSAEALNGLLVEEISQCVWDKMYRASLWKGIRFPEGRVYEDISTTYRVFAKSCIIHTLSDLLYKHRKRPGSITMTFSEKNIQDRLLAARCFEEYVNDNTPEVFSERNRKKYLDQTLRQEELLCAEVMSDPDYNKSFWQERRKCVLQDRRIKCRPKSVKSMLTHWLFLTCPGSIPHVRKGYLFCKKIVRKACVSNKRPAI